MRLYFVPLSVFNQARNIILAFSLALAIWKFVLCKLFITPLIVLTGQTCVEYLSLLCNDVAIEGIVKRVCRSWPSQWYEWLRRTKTLIYKTSQKFTWHFVIRKANPLNETKFLLVYNMKTNFHCPNYNKIYSNNYWSNRFCMEQLNVP